ncbi:MAG TPA: hypothetical protein VGK19_12550 [Capsulimonadaceae bacterium]|jgi:hypothetical protein
MTDVVVTDGSSEGEPSLWNQTVQLGTLLRDISDNDPEGRPTGTAVTAFRHWLDVAQHKSSEARYFIDIAENYDIEGRSNRDLFDVFELLHPFVEIEAPEDVSPARIFINLPTM